MGFSIGENCLGYGVVIHHAGSIVCGPSNRVGNYALLNTSTCIVERGSVIKDGLFLGTGAVITKKVVFGDNIWVGANSVVSKSYPEGGALIIGIPAEKKKDNNGAWYDVLYGIRWRKRHEEVELLKEKMQID